MFAKLKVYLIMFAAFALFAGAAYWYYIDTQRALVVAAQNQAKLEISLTTQKQATQALQKDLARMTESINKLNVDFNSSRQDVLTLEKKFNQSANGKTRDIGKLAIAQPGMIQERVNKGSNEVFRCVELLSGQAPIQGEADEKQFINCINSNDTDSLQ